MTRTSLFAAALLLAGCSKNIDTTDAVRQGIMDYLSSTGPKIGLDLSSMQVDVTAVSFEQDHAHATVSFTPKTGQGALQLAYNLDRQGDKWVVHGNAMSAGSAHGAQGSAPDTQGGTAPGQAAPGGTQLPPGHPGVGSAPGGTQLPPGHPGVGSAPGGTQLPPGHPAVGTKSSSGNQP